jgi:hypothetical protein
MPKIAQPKIVHIPSSPMKLLDTNHPAYAHLRGDRYGQREIITLKSATAEFCQPERGSPRSKF